MKPLLVIPALVLTAIIAFAIGRWNKPSEPPELAKDGVHGTTYNTFAAVAPAPPPSPDSDTPPAISLDEALDYILNKDELTGFAYTSGLYRVVENLSLDEIQLLLIRIREKAELDSSHWSRMNIPLSRWADFQPEAAIRFIESIDNHHSRWFTNTVIQSWARQDTRAALAYAQTIEDEQQKNLILTSLARQIATTDPERALALIQSLPRPSQNESHAWAGNYAYIINRIAGDDHNAALRQLEAIDDHSLRQIIRQNFMIQLSQKDPALAMSLAARHDDQHNNSSSNILYQWINRTKRPRGTMLSASTTARASSACSPPTSAGLGSTIPTRPCRSSASTSAAANDNPPYPPS